MKKLDCLGEMCPIPLIKLQKELAAIRGGEAVVLVTDHSCTLVSTTDFCNAHKLSLISNEVMEGVWEITVFQDRP